jgi:hypothetical protein
VLLCLTAWSVRAQEPLSTTPQRVTGGIQAPVETAAKSAPILRGQSSLFLDTLPLSRMTAISLGVPGFSQLYNNQYWKIPVLYGSIGTLTYFGLKANKEFRHWNSRYTANLNAYYAMPGISYEEMARKSAFYNDVVMQLNAQRIRYNTQRQVYFAGAAAIYLYALADGVLNYPHTATPVKKATTLALVFPGAGQLYNKSYWKFPIVIGGFATSAFMIDWNARMYQRYRTAYNLHPNDEFSGGLGKEQLKSGRDYARRNRDLWIIVTGGFWLLTVVEAHVDAYMKDFDVSTDLTSLRVEPTLIDLSQYRSPGGYNTYPGAGLALRLNF